MLNTKRLIFVGLLYFCSWNVNAITLLKISSEFQSSSIVGTFSDDANFSWIKHRFPTSTTYFSWNFGGGTDGGIVFDQAQPFTSMVDTFTMFNQPTRFFSVGTGLSIVADKTINMVNLRMKHAGDTIDIGGGSGYDTLVPYLSDFSLLTSSANGWASDAAGNYHLFYNTAGICAGCEMTIHLYGTAVVPVPAALWLFGSGLSMITFVARRRTS